MTPSSRVASTIDLFQRIISASVPMDTTCGDFFRNRRYIGSKDRAAIAEMVYELMRHYARTAYILEQNELEISPRTRLIAYLAMQGNPQWIKDIFDGSKYGPDPLNEAENEFLQDFMVPEFPEEIAVECPEGFEGALRDVFGKEFMPEMQAMLRPATLDLRVNTAKAPVEKVQNYLEADGVATEPTSYSPWGLRCKRKAYLSKTKAMAKGWIDIQDEGSQLIALACDAGPGYQVLDYCAGAGGKTLALAAAMQNKGRIVAMDLDTRRLEKSRQRFKKAGVSDMIEVRPLEVEKNRKWLRRQKGTFDRVLCDVPCSGTGTWRRNPDMRWRTYGPDIEELIPVQADILARVAHTVKPGGRLIYATCSLLRQENEKQIEHFLECHPEFRLCPIRDQLPSLPQWEKGHFMRLTPNRCATDGFFAAVLERKAA